jgi:hypothetical protein
MKNYKIIKLILISIFFVDCILGIFIGTNIINIIGYKKK